MEQGHISGTPYTNGFCTANETKPARHFHMNANKMICSTYFFNIVYETYTYKHLPDKTLHVQNVLFHVEIESAKRVKHFFLSYTDLLEF